MKPLYAVAMLAALSACGGTSISEEVQQNIVSSGGSLASPTTSVPSIAAPSNPSGDASFANLLNNVRIDNGAGSVTYNSRLNEAAQDHADDMLENNYFSHTGLNGSTLGTRVTDAGYNYSRVGENIASGYQTEESVLNGWVNSPGHQRNNIDPNFEEFGLGVARDGSSTRWVLVLGTER